jgi:nucleoside 2-deoxyribosyltransferase
MATCFVIQPFDAGKFDKRFEQVFKPAIEAAGLEAYRVDKDPRVDIPIDAIEDGIRSAAVCLADITTDNPNVWYELGYAFASGRPVVMVCSEERTGKKYPFDIQHRTVISYLVEAPGDFVKLRDALTERMKALLERGAALEKIAESEPVATLEGLSQAELLVLALVAGDASLPSSATSLFSVRRSAEQSGLTNVGFSLGVRRLVAKRFVELGEDADYNGEPYDIIAITEAGWSWIESNENLFVIHRPKKRAVPDVKGFEDDDIPF